jgi:hypothetical protein
LPLFSTSTMSISKTYAMTTDPEPTSDRNAGSQRALRGGLALFVVALLLAGLLLLVDFEKERPNYYVPARAPITEAATILSETYAEEKELVQLLQTVHNRLDQAISLLGRAERLDAVDKRQIETLRVRLQTLEDADRMRSTDAKDLKRAYQDLTEQLNALAEKLAQPRK